MPEKWKEFTTWNGYRVTGCWVVSKLVSSSDELSCGLDAVRRASASSSDRPGEILVEYNE